MPKSRLIASIDLPRGALQKIAMAARYRRSGRFNDAKMVPEVMLKSR
jgi:hypothetical protein